MNVRGASIVFVIALSFLAGAIFLMVVGQESGCSSPWSCFLTGRSQYAAMTWGDLALSCGLLALAFYYAARGGKNPGEPGDRQ